MSDRVTIMITLSEEVAAKLAEAEARLGYEATMDAIDRLLGFSLGAEETRPHVLRRHGERRVGS